MITQIIPYAFVANNNTSAHVVSSSEGFIIGFVCIFGISPLFLLLFALALSERCGKRAWRPQGQETAALLPRGDEEAGSENDGSYCSSSVAETEDGEVGGSHCVAPSKPLCVTMIWHPVSGWRAKLSKHRYDGLW